MLFSSQCFKKHLVTTLVICFYITHGDFFCRGVNTFQLYKYLRFVWTTVIVIKKNPRAEKKKRLKKLKDNKLHECISV